MKTVWIILGILAALGLACCGGMFLFGKGLFDKAMETNDQANAYSAKILPDIAKDWDINTLGKYASKEFQEQVSEADILALLKVYKEKLGKYKSSEEFSSTGFEAKTNTEGSYVLVTTKALAEFEKGKGSVTLEVLNRKNEWKLLSIEINSEALKK